MIFLSDFRRAHRLRRGGRDETGGEGQEKQRVTGHGFGVV
jgi:hypothetical protein